MSNCIFCTVPDIIYKNTPIYNVEVPVIAHQTNTTIFTPRARLLLSPEDANRLIKHREAWISHYNSNSPHAIIAESQLNPLIGKQIESMKLPKDWDIIKISATEYVLTKRAANVLILATQQYHDTVTELINTLSILKVIDLRN